MKGKQNMLQPFLTPEEASYSSAMTSSMFPPQQSKGLPLFLQPFKMIPPLPFYGEMESSHTRLKPQDKQKTKDGNQ